MARSTASSQPLRGGSTTTTSGASPLATSAGSTASLAPTMNSALRTPLRTAFSRAFSIASGTISMPMTCFARFASSREMVPAPQ